MHDEGLTLDFTAFTVDDGNARSGHDFDHFF